MAPLEIIEITAADGALSEAVWLARAETVHRQLRPALPADYVGRLREIFANGGRLAVVAEEGAVRALALWRLIENTYEGRRLYVDDLVTDEARRSQGYGQRLLGWLEEKARQQGCQIIALDSGVQRAQAHQFYFREGLHIASFSFRKAAKP
jgi:GNAT superfamily N-acetyltransferase